MLLTGVAQNLGTGGRGDLARPLPIINLCRKKTNRGHLIHLVRPGRPRARSGELAEATELYERAATPSATTTTRSPWPPANCSSSAC